MSRFRYPQVFIELGPNAGVGAQVTLNQEDSHHIGSVLRLKEGDTIQITDLNSSSSFTAELNSVGKTAVSAALVERVELTAWESCVSSLAIANLKGKNSGLVIEKAVELGVKNLIVFEAERSVKKLGKDSSNTLERFQKIAKSAAAQSNKDYLPSIYLCSTLAEAIDQINSLVSENDLLFCASLLESADPISSFKSQENSCHIIVGPEGDFSEKEYALLDEARWHHVSLGPFVLRSETAAIAAVAMASSTLGYRQKKQ